VDTRGCCEARLARPWDGPIQRPRRAWGEAGGSADKEGAYLPTGSRLARPHPDL